MGRLYTVTAIVEAASAEEAKLVIDDAFDAETVSVTEGATVPMAEGLLPPHWYPTLDQYPAFAWSLRGQKVLYAEHAGVWITNKILALRKPDEWQPPVETKKPPKTEALDAALEATEPIVLGARFDDGARHVYQCDRCFVLDAEYVDLVMALFPGVRWFGRDDLNSGVAARIDGVTHAILMPRRGPR